MPVGLELLCEDESFMNGDPTTAVDLMDQWFLSVGGWSTDGALRQILFAVIALLVFLLTAPRGRRGLAWSPFMLLLVCPFSLATSMLLSETLDKPQVPRFVMHFFALASVLQSLLLIALVACWERVIPAIPKIFLDVLRLLMILTALLVVLWEAGADAGELFAGSAVLTAVLGFALKDTLGNVFAGLAIHAEHPFELGDWIQYDTQPAHIGKVVEINWRATRVITLDEACVIIPNGQLAQASIRNFTKPQPWSRRSLFVITPYTISPQHVQQIILQAIRGSFGVLEHPAPSVVTNNFVERGVEYWVRLFTNEFGARDKVDGMARDRIWYALSRHGIEIPVATQAFRLSQHSESLETTVPAEIEQRIACLKMGGLFDALPAFQLRQLAEKNATRVYGADESIIRQGEAAASMFVVVDGQVQVTASQENTAPVLVKILQAGDFFGEMSLLTGSARVATVTALVESRILEISKQSFQAILHGQPDLVEALGLSLQSRLTEHAKAMAGAKQVVADPPDLLQKIRDLFVT